MRRKNRTRMLTKNLLLYKYPKKMHIVWSYKVYFPLTAEKTVSHLFVYLLFM